MSENEEQWGATPAAGFVSSPRDYFGRASRAATAAPRAPAQPAAAPGPRRPNMFRAGDPALRVFPELTLPFPPTEFLTGAIATLSGIADGEREKLMIEVGTSLVRVAPRRDEAAGTLALILARPQSAEVYRALLASLRYIDDAREPKPGLRKLALKTVDADGTVRVVAAATIAVGDIAPEFLPEAAPAAAVTATDAVAEASTGSQSPAPAAPQARDRRIVLGESVQFNSEGDFTLFWWPRLLAAGRSRQAKPVDAAPDAAGLPSSFFSQGGRHYRVFDTASEAPSPRRAPPAVIALAKKAPEGPANDVWMPGRGLPPPGFASAPPLRLEDVFGSDMENALVRRLIEHRIATGA